MILMNIARIICLAAALVSGWAVYINLVELFSFWISLGGAVGVGMLVFCLLYFPLARHIADAVSDRMSVAMHRGRHIRAGSGLDSIPEPPKALHCTVCGGPGGPICPKCDEKMSMPSKRAY